MRNSFDWTPYRRSTVGFDRLFDFLETGGSAAENYPPFDIEKVADDHFRITVAVAGFKPDEIDITAQQNMLTVSGRSEEHTSELQSLMRISYAVFCLKKKTKSRQQDEPHTLIRNTTTSEKPPT